MNLLPFVMIIVLVLGMFSLSQFQRNNSLEKEKNTYIAYFKGLRETRNDLEDMAYVNAKKKKSNHTPSSSTPSEPQEKDDIKERPFFRERKVGWPSGRLNLSSLLDDSQKNDLKNITLAYLLSLYGHKAFFPKDPKPLVDVIIAKLKTSKDLISLHELKLDDPKMHDIFYKMLRGTHTYNLKEQGSKDPEGYPPFDHFFTFEKSSHPPMNFNSANEVFLKVALGESIATGLIKKEKEKVKTNALSSPLSKDEINDIFKNIFPSPKDLFNFNSSGTQKNPEMYVDSQTKITVRIE